MPVFGGNVAMLSKNDFLLSVSTVPTTVPLASLPRDDGRTQTLTLARLLQQPLSNPELQRPAVAGGESVKWG
jgi:hypothetical protein